MDVHHSLVVLIRESLTYFSLRVHFLSLSLFVEFQWLSTINECSLRKILMMIMTNVKTIWLFRHNRRKHECLSHDCWIDEGNSSCISFWFLEKMCVFYVKGRSKKRVWSPEIMLPIIFDSCRESDAERKSWFRSPLLLSFQSKSENWGDRHSLFFSNRFLSPCRSN